MLIATDYARKMSLDMRMISQKYEDHPDSKASHCAAKLALYYNRFNAQKGTQFVFSDFVHVGGNKKFLVILLPLYAQSKNVRMKADRKSVV